MYVSVLKMRATKSYHLSIVPNMSQPSALMLLIIAIAKHGQSFDVRLQASKPTLYHLTHGLGRKKL